MKELRFWYLSKWKEYVNSHIDHWPRKPYGEVKGFADDYQHLTRKDLRKWWNERKPGAYPQCEGFEDDDTILTQQFLDNWFKIVSPDGWIY